eukprot:9958-Heterococcus_DN1.PRE.4
MAMRSEAHMLILWHTTSSTLAPQHNYCDIASSLAPGVCANPLLLPLLDGSSSAEALEDSLSSAAPAAAVAAATA